MNKTFNTKFINNKKNLFKVKCKYKNNINNAKK